MKLSRNRSRVVLVILIAGYLLIGSVFWAGCHLGEGGKSGLGDNHYDNDVYIFDDSVAHEMRIDLNPSDYDAMVKEYQETGEKEYYRANVTIDGVTIPDVGIRLKGNLTLMLTLGGSPSFKGPGGRNGGPPFDLPEGAELPEGMFPPFMRNREMMNNLQDLPMPPGIELPENWGEMTDEERLAHMAQNGRGGLPGMGTVGGNPPFLIKFDEFIPGQTYQNFTEIAVRLGNDKSLLGEPISFYIHRESGQVIPETAYAVVECAENEPSLYVICEHIDGKYTEKHFPDSKGVLYKAGNFAGFDYKGEDADLYKDLFKQKTSKTDDDLKPLIGFLKFVSESSDEEFESELSNRLDIPSFIRMMAVDNLIDNHDSFVGIGSNYYLYYDKDMKRFTFLSWDMNLSLQGMPGMMMRRIGEEGEPQLERMREDVNRTDSEEQKRAVFEEWLRKGGGFGNDDCEDCPDVGPFSGKENVLKKRFFENETFSKMYDEEYNNLKVFIFSRISVLEKVDAMAQVFTSYNKQHNILEQSEYDSGVERIKSYFTEKQKEFGLH